MQTFQENFRGGNILFEFFFHILVQYELDHRKLSTHFNSTVRVIGFKMSILKVNLMWKESNRWGKENWKIRYQ